jgi:uncharacterized protein YwgA
MINFGANLKKKKMKILNLLTNFNKINAIKRVLRNRGRNQKKIFFFKKLEFFN